MSRRGVSRDERSRWKYLGRPSGVPQELWNESVDTAVMGTVPHLSVLKGPTNQVKQTPLDVSFEKIAEDGAAADNVALIFEENGQVHTTTYSDLDKSSNRLSRTIIQTIRSRNLSRNDDGDYIIAVKMHPSDDLVQTLLAILKSGCAYLPLDHSFPGNRIAHIIGESRPVMAIYDSGDGPDGTYSVQFRDLANESSGKEDGKIPDREKLRHVKDDLAIVLYTSGSTGVPKGVRLPHKTIQNRLQWQFRRFPFAGTERTCVFKTALTFVDSVSELWGPLICGLSVVVVPKALTRDPEKLCGVLEKYQIERLVLVPSLLRSLLMYLELQKRDAPLLRRLKLWVCSGETLAVSLVEEFFRYFPEGDDCDGQLLCNFYGSTEVMGDVTYHVITGMGPMMEREKVPIGAPLDNTAIYLLDKDLRPVRSGEVGELFCAGANLAAGYVNGRDPDRFLDNPLAVDPAFGTLYRTGDYASVRQGALVYEGRLDSQVKIRGHRVDLAEVEAAVNAVEGVEKAVVLCYKPGEMSQALLAFVASGALIGEHQIEAALKDKLTSYMVPQVVLIERIPLLVNGKTDRQALLKFYENTNNNDDSSPEIDVKYDGVPQHRMEAAKTLFETVASVLNRSARGAVSIDANFYDIGGNSLNSIYTISKLNEKGYNISISDFISAMDLGEVLLRMTKGEEISSNPPSYTSEMLKPGHKNVVIDMVTTSFYEKADLEQWIISEITASDYSQLLDAVWTPLLEKNLSFLVRSETGKIVGVSLNFDARDEPEVEVRSRLTVIFEFLETLEGPIRDTRLPQGIGTVLHAFMMATHSSLASKENVAVMQFMEEEVIAMAQQRGFEGIFTTNSSPLTQQLGSYVFKYQTLLDYQVNQFVASDGSRPFALAPDDQRAVVHWKAIK